MYEKPRTHRSSPSRLNAEAPTKKIGVRLVRKKCRISDMLRRPCAGSVLAPTAISGSRVGTATGSGPVASEEAFGTGVRAVDRLAAGLRAAGFLAAALRAAGLRAAGFSPAARAWGSADFAFEARDVPSAAGSVFLAMVVLLQVSRR